MSQSEFEPLYTAYSCASLTVLAILWFFNPAYLHFYITTLAAWSTLIWNHWCVSTHKNPNRDIDAFLPVSIAALMTLYYLHAAAEPLHVVWTYLLVAMPSLSAYMLSTITPHLQVYKDLICISMLLAMATSVFVISGLVPI